MMLKNLMAGLLIGGTATVAIAGLTSHVVNAQAEDVATICAPRGSWMRNVGLYQVVALSPGDAWSAEVLPSTAGVRSGAGLSHSIVATLNQGDEVVVTGESWDSGCNQWMRIRYGGSEYWVRGNDLAKAGTSNIGPSLSGPEQCPSNPTWARGYEFYETIPHTPPETSKVVSSAANVRSGSGMSHSILATLPRGTEITITGEAWDSGCNQWMQVEGSGVNGWIHGYTVE
jgi:uncharacterized protein YraI